MAHSALFPRPKNVTKIKSYSVTTSHVLGQGAFGIVFKGTDGKNNPVAAKRIDGSDHTGILSVDYNRLLRLNHPNIIRILDIERQGDILWMFMPFCELGDLNKYYRTRDVKIETSLNIMEQILSGITYLHSCNIIHRDIKPGNILVACDEPVCVKLTDFDVTKFLDPEIETSVMSSNVGTNAFKAPEFFLRNDRKKIQYHRNVDVYAAGLTFLAMLQHRKPSTMLIPHIETPKEDSELHVPTGQLVAERIKYKVTERDIVVIAEESSEEQTNLLRRAMRKLVKKMTCENPEDRLSALQSEILLRKVYPVLMREICTLEEMSHVVTTKKYFVLSGDNVDGNNFYGVLDLAGNFVKYIGPPCQHEHLYHSYYCTIEHPTNPDHLLVACRLCEAIYLYKIKTGEAKKVYRQCKPHVMCLGPGDAVLILGDDGKVLELRWDEREEKLQLLVHHFTLSEPGPVYISMCYVKFGGILVILSQYKLLEARELGTGSVLWNVEDEMVDGTAVACDPFGRLYVSRYNNLLIMDATNRDLLQENRLKASIKEMSLSGTRLVLVTSDNKVTCYSVT